MPNNANIDERVVEMRIDNRQFVDGAEKTISVLDRLKEALSFKKAGDGFAEVQNAANKVDLSGMASDIEKISSRFSDMGIVGQRVIQNLTDSVYGFVKNTITGLTIDPITQGFSKYEDILRNTQTIMSATMNEEIPARFGSQFEYVEHELEMAEWYTDETSASLQDIVSNVSKFTNIGVPLQDALYDMQGIANWGWSAGASVQEMSRAMYNLAQAMSVGSVKLMDWRSIENANMGTLEFKQTAIDTAVALGTLIDVGDGLYQTLEGNAVSAKNFNDALKDEWFTADVLEQTLRIYGDYSRRLGDVMNDMGLTDAGLAASDVMRAVDKVSEAVEKGMALDEALAAWQEKLSSDFTEETLPSIEQLRYAYQLLTGDEDALAEHAAAMGAEWEKLTKEQFELSKRAFLMGQEYKTFGDVIDATKDAVSTGWMKTFQLIIGNAEEAKEFWTEVGDIFYDIFAASAARRNAILKWWNTTSEGIESGRDALLKLTDDYPSALGNLLRAIKSYIEPITNAFESIFSWGAAEKAGERLRELTYRVRDFMAKLELSEGAQEGMTNFFKSIFYGAKQVLGIFKPFLKFVGTAIVTVRDFVNLFFESFASGKFDKQHFLSGLPDVFKNIGDNVKAAWEGIKSFIDSIKDAPIVGTVFKFITDSIGTIGSKLGEIVGKVKDVNVDVSKLEGPLGKIQEFFSKIWGYVSNINIDTATLKESFGKIGDIISTVYEGLSGDVSSFKDRIKLMLQTAIQAVKETLSEISFSDIMEGARLGIMGYTAIQFAEFVASFKKAADSFKSIPEAITGTFESLSKTIESYGKAQNATSMLKMAGAILMVAGAILALSMIPEDKFAAIAVTLAFFFVVLSKIAKSISSSKNFADNKNNLFVKVIPDFAASIIAVAILLAVVAATLIKLKDLSWPEIAKGLTAIAAGLLIGIFALAALSKYMDKGVDVKALGKLITVAFVINAVGKAFERVKDLNAGQILAAAVGFAAVLGVIVGLMAVIKGVDTANGVGAMLSLVAIAITMTALIPPFMVFASFDWDSVMKVLVVVLVVAAAVSTIMGVLAFAGSKGAIKGAAALVVVGAAMVLFSAALLIASPAIIAFVGAIVAVMNVIAGVENIFQKLFLLAALGVALVPLGIGLQAVAVGALEFSAAVLIAAVGFGIFSAALLAIASAIGILTAVLIPFGTVLIDFCNMVAENGQVLVGVVSTIILAVLTAILMSKANIAYSVVAVILAVVGAIVENGPAILQSLAQILEQVLLFLYQLIPMLIKFLVASVIFIINGVADTLRANKAALISAIENLISVIIEVVIEVFWRLVGDIFGTVGQWFGKLAGLLTGADVDIGRDVSDWFAGIGKGMSDGVYNAFGGAERAAGESGENIVGSLTGGVQSASEQVPGVLQECLVDPVSTATDDAGEAAATGGTGILSKFAGGINLSAPSIAESLGGTFSNVAKSADMSGEGATYGSNFITSIGNAAIEEGPWLNDIMSQLAGNASSSFANSWQINSPSKVGERLGRFWDLGIINGLEGGAGDINDTSSSMANRMTEAMQTAMTNLAALSQEDFTISPVITPVVDMTNVENEARNVSSMFQNPGTGQANGISRNMASAQATANNMRNAGESTTNISQDQFTINVYGTADMDENELSDLVLQKLMDNLARKGASLG